MKNILRIAAVFAVAVIVTANFSSCSKDDDDRPEKSVNYMRIGSKTYELGSAQCWYRYGSVSKLTYSDIYLYAKGATFDHQTGLNANCNGIAVNLYYLSSNSDGRRPKSGTYTYSSTEGDLKHDGGSDYIMNYNDEYDVDVDVDWVRFGANNCVITVKSLGNDQFEITWSGTDENKNTVSGYYKGLIHFFISK